MKKFSRCSSLGTAKPGSAKGLGRGFDILVNSAGVGIFAKVSPFTLQEWDKMIQTNLNGAFYCSRETLSIFANKGGRCIEVGSWSGEHALAGGAAYNTCNAVGLSSFSEALLSDRSYDNAARMQGEFGKSAPDLCRLLQMPERTMVSQVGIRRAKPKRTQE
jgi:3-oxoacyl-[acyl-carrier protein] reductase